MKWLIIQSDGEHKRQDGWTPNSYLRECVSLQYALRFNGHDADVWGLRHPNYLEQPDLESYDCVVIAENYELSWLPDLSGIQRPRKIHWIIDLHYQGAAPYLPISRQCDTVLHATRSLMKDYAVQVPHANHHWFPNAADNRYFYAAYPSVPRNRDLVFVGGEGGRAPILKLMRERAGLVFYYPLTGWDYISLLHQTKIQFNAPVAGDINYRNFETIGMGCCLLTAYDPDLELLGFRHGVNCLFYKTPEEAVQLAKECLRDGTWEAIGAAGRALFCFRHSYRARVRDLCREIFGCSQ